MPPLVLLCLIPNLALAQTKLLRRIDTTAWVRSVELLEGAELGFLAHLDTEVGRLAPGYFGRQSLVRPSYIVDVAAPQDRRSAGIVMAVGGRIVLHTSLGTIRRFERSGLVPGLCRVWAVANRIQDDCQGFVPYFDLHSPPLFPRPAPAGAFLDITVAGDETAPLSCFLTVMMNEQQRVFAASDAQPVHELPIPAGLTHFEARCHRLKDNAVEETLYEGMVVAHRSRRLHVRLDWGSFEVPRE